MKKIFILMTFGLLSLGAFTQNYSKQQIDSLKMLAEKGNAESQNELGGCYYNGEGVAENKAEAVKWFKKAAEQGHEAAKNALKRLGY